jgi:PAS domain S-box-containing protein
VNKFKYAPSKRLIVPLIVLLMGVASIALLIFTNKIHEKFHVYFMFDDMIHEVEISLLKSHLLLEEIAHKDPLVEIEDVRTDLDLALNTLNVMLSGGKSFHGKYVPVLTEPELRSDISSLKPLILELRTATENRYMSGLETSKDKHYDELFNRLMGRTDAIIGSFEASLIKYEKKLLKLFWSILIFWSLILLVSIVGLLIITLRRNRIENMLYESEELFRSVANTANDAIVTVDAMGSITYWNHGAEHIFGFSSDEALGNPVTAIIPEHFRVAHSASLGRVVSGGKSKMIGKTVECVGLRKDGSDFSAELSLATWQAHDEIFFTAIIRDISNRKEIERLLRISRERYRSVVDDQTDLVCRWTGDGILTFVNDAFCLYYGRDRDELIGISFQSFMVDDEWRRIKEHADSLLMEVPFGELEIYVNTDEGGRWQRWTNRAFYENDDVVEYQSVVHDITIRKQMDNELKKYQDHLEELVEERTRELKQSNERLEKEMEERRQAEEQVRNMALFAEMNPSPVLRFDKNGNVLMAYPAAAETLSHDSLRGALLKSVIPGTADFDLAECIRGGEIISHATKIGNRYFHFLFRGLPLFNFGQIYGSDITEQKKAEDETIRTSQLASLGELAAGVAHEINNPINGIINFAQILADKSEQGGRENEMAGQIIHEGDRIASIVTSLLSFARNEQEEKTPVLVQDIISDSLSLTRAQLRKDGIKLVLDIPSDLPVIMAHFQKIEQVIINLINNARYALNQKYTQPNRDKIIKITGSTIEFEDMTYVQITFLDHGTGISEDLLHKIMNPFFSTKPRGTGTGLGLSISHSIISNHGGNLRIESSEGEFTKVIIDIPCNKAGLKMNGK